MQFFLTISFALLVSLGLIACDAREDRRIAAEKKRIANMLPFTWEDCGLEDRTVQFHNLVLAPLPLKFTKQTFIEVTADFNAKEDIREDAMVEIKIRRLQRLFGTKVIRIPLPCMDGVLGSCTLRFCDYIKDPRISPIFCALMKATGKECTCPVKAAEYKSISVPVTLNLSRIPLPAFLIKLGTVRTFLSIDLPVRENVLTSFSYYYSSFGAL